jgi:LCP family protein required for cell wall assembly
MSKDEINTSKHRSLSASLEETRPHSRPAKRPPILVRLLMIGSVFVCFTLASMVLIPARTNILLLGIDRTPEGSVAGRSDTMILMSVQSPDVEINMLSIPRDLWVTIPGMGENRINAAHLFAEMELPGDGPVAAIDTVEYNFGVPVRFYLRIQFEGLRDFTDALGGIPLELDTTMGKFPPGSYLLDGETALAFVRDRSGGDDFFRMEHAQVFLRAVMTHMLNPETWPRLPGAFLALRESVDGDIPIWFWPRLLFALANTGIDGIEMRSIDRTMVTGTTTNEGAQVLLPDWSKINPLLIELFDR